MIKNYFKTALRNLLRHKLYAAINLFGLAVGLAVVMLIYLFIRHELSYDDFFENAENIYRVDEADYMESGVVEQYDWLGYPKPVEGIRKYPYQPLPLGAALKEEIPEVRQFCRYDQGQAIIRRDNVVDVEDIYYADANFFQLFSFPLLSGEARTVLDDKNGVVLTPDFARKYFGRENPVGQELIIDLQDTAQVFMVAGVAAAPPQNSSIRFGVLLRLENRPSYAQQMDRWGSFNTPLFLELADGVNPAATALKINAFRDRQYADFLSEARTRRKLVEDEPAMVFSLTRLNRIHLNAAVPWIEQGSAQNILILGGIALLILIVACLNYISLSLTGASGRILEVGIRKVLGSTPRAIAWQFWLEAQLLVLIAVVVAVALVELFVPVFSDFVQRDLDFSLWQNAALAVPLLLIALVTGLVAGGYPALFIARFRPVVILKGNNTYRHQPAFIKGAVVVQFALSVFLIISSLVMYRQMRYVNGKDLGYNREQVLVLTTNTGWNDEGERLVNLLRERLQQNAGVLYVSGTSASFNRGWDINGYETPDGETHRAYIYRGDYDYLPALGVELVAGRNFSQDFPTDPTEAIIVNEALVRDLGMGGNPIGQEVPWRKDHNRKIIGVVPDYHFSALTEEVSPLILHLNPEEAKISNALIKIAPGKVPETMAAVEREWKALAPAKPFAYSFLDDDVAAQYDAFRRWLRIMGVAAGFAIFIAALGLFGLAGIMAVNKTKEVGIRKVLGASLTSIMVLLNKDLARLAGLALLIAAPAAWYVMRRWLDHFEYRIDLGWTTFALAGLACLVVAFVAVSYHSLRAAASNPVDSLRRE